VFQKVNPSKLSESISKGNVVLVTRGRSWGGTLKIPMHNLKGTSSKEIDKGGCIQ
jgi:hypothetical protein